ncbi:hypothetical protein ACFXJ5_04660 [Streptomyces sp. NPDC059373]
MAAHGGDDRLAGGPVAYDTGGVLVQETAPREQLGVATTSIRFFQTLGNALGAALFGSLLSRVYASKVPGGSTSDMGPGAVADFVSSIDVVFLAASGVMLLALLLATRLRVPSGGSYGPCSPVDQRAVVPVGAEQ